MIMDEAQSDGFNIFGVLDQVKHYWKKIRWYVPVCLALGLVVGGYLYYKKSQETIQYYGKTTFMLSSDDIASGGGLSSALGIMLPGSGDAGGNKVILLELLKSHRMIEQALLSTAEVDGNNDLLINHYIQLAGYRDAWKGDQQWENYSYPIDYMPDSIEIRDAFLRNAAINIATSYTPEKTEAGIFEIEFIHENEEFAKAFLDNLVITIIDYYTEKKTAKARVIFQYAKNRHDELYGRMNGQQRSLARMQDKTSEFVFVEDRVPQMLVSRDIEATSGMLEEASKSLAAARMSLVQETPYIQVIDDVRMPLTPIVPKKEKYGAIGLAGGFVGSLILLVGIFVGLDFLKKQKQAYQSSRP